MATRIISPGANNEGGFGTDSLRFAQGHFETFHIGGEEIPSTLPADLEAAETDLYRRTVEPMFYHDGATAAAGFSAALGSKGDIGTDDFAHRVWVQFPATAPGSARGIGGFSSVSTAVGANGIGLRLSGSDLQIRMHGATTGDYRQILAAGLRTTYAGKFALVVLTRTAGVIALKVAGSAVTLTSETTDGTPPAWADAIDSTYLVLGMFAATELWAGQLSAPAPYNRALTGAEIAAYQKNGDSFSDLAAGSQVAILGTGVRNGGFTDFTGGAPDTWITGASLTVTQTADGIEVTGAGTLSTGDNTLRNGAFDGVKAGVRYAIDVRARRIDGTSASTLGIRRGAAINEFDEEITSADTDWHIYSFPANIMTETGSGAGGQIRVGASAGITWEIDYIRVRKTGLISNHEVTRTAQVRDRINGLHGLITPGVTPLRGKLAPITGTQSATGFVLGDQGIVFDDHFIDRVRVKPTSTVPNLTLRRTSAAGTVVVATVSAGVAGEWKTLDISGAGIAGNAGDKYHWTFSESAEIEYEITPTAR